MPPDIMYMSLGVVDRHRVRFTSRGHTTRYLRRTTGWQIDTTPPAPVPLLEVRMPARVGTALELRTNVTGPIVLEQESTGLTFPVADHIGPNGGNWLPVPGLGDVLRADQRYRLRSQFFDGEWFRPTAVTGATWTISGLDLSDIHALGGDARLERGVVGLSASLQLPADSRIHQLIAVTFIAMSDSPTPQLVRHGDRIWLVPTCIAMRCRNVTTRPPRNAFVTSLPLPPTTAAVGTWIHAQIAVHDGSGRLLGTSAVRSLRVSADQGEGFSQLTGSRARDVAIEHRGNAVTQVDGFWHAITSITAR